MATPEITQRITQLGLIPFAMPSVADMQAYIKADQDKWGAMVRKLGLEGTQ